MEKENILKWKLSDKSIFYKNILAFFICLNGIPALFDSNYVSTIKFDDSINLKGKTTGNNRFKRLELIEQMKVEFPNVKNAVKILIQQLVISCYVSVEDQNDKSPEFEFFRHLRNGCAHGNKFNFRNHKDKKTNKVIYDEPSRPAKWNGLEINQTLHGSKVIFDFIAGGDVLKLLIDMSKKIENFK
jgi:hypothetical protein